jgi:hypothetical protein
VPPDRQGNSGDRGQGEEGSSGQAERAEDRGGDRRTGRVPHDAAEGEPSHPDVTGSGVVDRTRGFGVVRRDTQPGEQRGCEDQRVGGEYAGERDAGGSESQPCGSQPRYGPSVGDGSEQRLRQGRQQGGRQDDPTCLREGVALVEDEQRDQRGDDPLVEVVDAVLDCKGDNARPARVVHPPWSSHRLLKHTSRVSAW